MTTRIQLRPPVEEMVFRLYNRPMHPELFDILASRRIKRPDVTLDLWITTTGHVISWGDEHSRLTELTSAGLDSPGWGQLLSHRLRGERCDMLSTLPSLNYQVSFQVELLPPPLFAKVQEEILADGGQNGLLLAYNRNHRWALNPVSAIHVESREGSLSLATFHTFPDEGAVVKTQSLIERR